MRYNKCDPLLGKNSGLGQQWSKGATFWRTSPNSKQYLYNACCDRQTDADVIVRVESDVVMVISVMRCCSVCAWLPDNTVLNK